MVLETLKNKVVFRCPIEDKVVFDESSCSVTVSIGNQNQEGEKFAATICAITNSFKKCDIMVCDSLQRHNVLMEKQIEHEFAHKEANNLGCSWIQRNKKYFSLFTIPYNIIHWDYWFFNDQYKLARSKIDNFFANNEEYRKAFFNAVDPFYKRIRKRTGHKITPENIVLYSLEYLKEECAVMLLWAENKYNFEIYPSKRNFAMAATYEHFIKPAYLDVLRPISLDIRSRKKTL